MKIVKIKPHLKQ